MMRRKVPDQVTIELPGRIHPSLNVWKKWSDNKYYEHKIMWAHDISMLASGKRHLNWSNVIVNITYITKTGQPKDYDNYAPKLIMDALQVAGLIQDDAAHMAEVDWVFEKDPIDLKTIIQITNVSERAVVPYLIKCQDDGQIYCRSHCAECNQFMVFSKSGVYCKLMAA